MSAPTLTDVSMRNTLATRSLFELSQPGRRAAVYPSCDVPKRPLEELIPAEHLADAPPPLPELAEPSVVRHFVNLSTLNMSVDTHYYPLGSCTMKYNPKRHERLARTRRDWSICIPMPARKIHRECSRSCSSCRKCSLKSPVLPGVSLQPAAGAQGELAALLIAAAYFRDRGEQRTKVHLPSPAPTGRTPPAPRSPVSTACSFPAPITVSSIWTNCSGTSTTRPPSS